MTKGKIVLIPFPFDNLSSSKVRPAVCLTDRIGIHNHVVLAFITSQVSIDQLESDVVIYANRKYFKNTGLRVSSTIKLHRLMTVRSSVILRELGKIPQEIQDEIDKKLMKLFKL